MVPVIKNAKLCRPCMRRTRDEMCRFLGIELMKIYLIGSNVSIFENRKKW